MPSSSPESGGGTFRVEWTAAPPHFSTHYYRNGDKMPLKIKRMIAASLLREIRAARNA